MTSTPVQSIKPVRLTIAVSPEVHATFSRLAEASGMSLGRAMGEWLEDTLDAASYTANLVEKARAAPKLVMKEVHAYALGLADETGELLRVVREKAGCSDVEPPRLVIRGGKSSAKSGTRGGKSRA